MKKPKKIDIFNFLSKSFLFESLSEDHLALIEAFSSEKKLARGDILFSDREPANAFFVVVSGKVKLYKLSSEGNEQILHIQKSGDLVAEAIIFEFDYYPAFCQALEETVLIRIPKLEFLNLLRHFSEIMFKIMISYSRRLRHLVGMVEELSLYNIKSRFANYLLKNSSLKNDRLCCQLNISKKNLAGLLGTIPETLSRTILFFKNENIIDEKKKVMTILDVHRLKSYIQT